jgi:hypothetical protein
MDMGVVSYVKRRDLSGDALKLYDERNEAGKLTNMVKTLLHSWPSFAAMEFYPVRNEMVRLVGERAVYFYCYAISTENRCAVCTIYHAQLLDEMGEVFDDSSLTDVERVLVDYGRALVRDANRVDEGIYMRLKEHFDDPGLVLVTTVGCKMIASNVFNSALQVEPAS